MPQYRRWSVPGGCWFFTVNLLDRRATLLTDHINVLRAVTAWTMRRYPFRIDAFVVLPDHLHAIWTLPEGDADFSTRWRMIKTRFARALPTGERRDATRVKRGERGIWQRRFWEHLIRDDDDYAQHVEYCAINPVSTGTCGASSTGRIRRFTATFGEGHSPRIGAPKSIWSVSSGSVTTRHRRAE